MKRLLELDHATRFRGKLRSQHAQKELPAAAPSKVPHVERLGHGLKVGGIVLAVCEATGLVRCSACNMLMMADYSDEGIPPLVQHLITAHGIGGKAPAELIAFAADVRAAWLQRPTKSRKLGLVNWEALGVAKKPGWTCEERKCTAVKLSYEVIARHVAEEHGRQAPDGIVACEAVTPVEGEPARCVRLISGVPGARLRGGVVDVSGAALTTVEVRGGTIKFAAEVGFPYCSACECYLPMEGAADTVKQHVRQSHISSWRALSQAEALHREAWLLRQQFCDHFVEEDKTDWSRDVNLSVYAAFSVCDDCGYVSMGSESARHGCPMWGGRQRWLPEMPRPVKKIRSGVYVVCRGDKALEQAAAASEAGSWVRGASGTGVGDEHSASMSSESMGEESEAEDEGEEREACIEDDGRLLTACGTHICRGALQGTARCVLCGVTIRADRKCKEGLGGGVYMHLMQMHDLREDDRETADLVRLYERRILMPV